MPSLNSEELQLMITVLKQYYEEGAPKGQEKQEKRVGLDVEYVPVFLEGQEEEVEEVEETPVKPVEDDAESEDESDDDDDDDPFGDLDDSDDDEETKAMMAAKAEQVKKIQARQAAKKGKARSNLTIDVKPDGAETDMDDIEAYVRAIEEDGLKWLGGQLIDVAFGIQKLRIMCQIVDEKIPSADNVVELVEQMVRKFSFQRKNYFVHYGMNVFTRNDAGYFNFRHAIDEITQ
jgi:translation elongation factor EF-1beta